MLWNILLLLLKMDSDKSLEQQWFFTRWFTWFRGILEYLGLANIKAKMLFLGLDNAGKTTLLASLASGRIRSCKPTIRPNSEELAMDNITFTTYDLGGHTSNRALWTEYLIGTDVVVYMVDATDEGRVMESKMELDHLLKLSHLRNIPFVVLGNKIDLPTAMSEIQLRNYLGLSGHLTTGKGSTRKRITEGSRPIEVFMCSVVERTGYTEAFRWVARYLS